MPGKNQELPPPPPNKTGWPWSVESGQTHKQGNTYPKITIVTPSYNQGKFLEETIRSVLLQNYPNLEYIIIDGGSSDNSIEIIKKYDQHITYWVSEKDHGQSHAINKGFEKATGEIGMWLCSDDLLCEGALLDFVDNHYTGPDMIYICKGYQIDSESGIQKELPVSNIDSITKLLDLPTYWRAKNRDSILQQSVLYPVEVFKSIGGLSEENYYTMDYEFWGKLFIHGLEVQRCNVDIGMFRWYKGQKTSFEYMATKELVKTAISLLPRAPLSREEKDRLKKRINTYWLKFQYHQFRSKIGIKRRLKGLFGLFSKTSANRNE